jgi:hypothetical protein
MVLGRVPVIAYRKLEDPWKFLRAIGRKWSQTSRFITKATFSPRIPLTGSQTRRMIREPLPSIQMNCVFRCCESAGEGKHGHSEDLTRELLQTPISPWSNLLILILGAYNVFSVSSLATAVQVVAMPWILGRKVAHFISANPGIGKSHEEFSNILLNYREKRGISHSSHPLLACKIESMIVKVDTCRRDIRGTLSHRIESHRRLKHWWVASWSVRWEKKQKWKLTDRSSHCM